MELTLKGNAAWLPPEASAAEAERLTPATAPSGGRIADYVADPFTVRVIGVQQLTRLVNQRPVEETRQLNLTVKLAKDELGRADRNQRTGYQITWFGWEELKLQVAL